MFFILAEVLIIKYNIMKELFLLGGPLKMSVLTILLVVMIIWIIYHFLKFRTTKSVTAESTLRMLNYGKSIGLFAMIVGIFYQLLGFYHAFSVIEQAGDISPALLYSGIKISMISTLYGILIYLLSIIIWFIASQFIENRKKA